MNKRWTKLLSIILVVVTLAVSATTIFSACTPEGGQTNTPTVTPPEDPVYTILFYTGNKSDADIDPITAKAGEPISAPTAPSMPGYTFAGWYEDFDVWMKPFSHFETMPAKNLVLYAKWEAVSVDAKKELEERLNRESKEGHLYIHYLRFVNTPESYEPYNLWVWPKDQTGIEFDWMRDENGQIIVDPIVGATCDVDLTKTYTEAGNDKDTTTTFLSRTDSDYQAGDIFNKEMYVDHFIGFLIVLEESKTGETHWTSDGGNQFIPKAKEIGSVYADRLRENGSVHIFANQEYVYDYVYSVAETTEAEDPYEGDDGTNVSLSNVDSSAVSTYAKAATAKGINGVGYQIMVSSFADSDGDGKGDIRGIIENLDYLESLSIDVLWLTPIQLSDSYHGYDIIDYKEVDPKFGSMADYEELLQKAHERGMKVIMDLVLNHTSINNVWFQKSAQLDPEYRSFYQWRNHKNEKLSDAWHTYGDHDYSYYGKFATSMPELNYDFQGTRDAIVDVATYWLAKGVDGFRIDAVKHIYMADETAKKSTDIIINDFDQETQTDYSSNVTKNINFFMEFNARVKEQYPNAYIVGENFDGNAYNVAPYYQGLDSMLNFYAYYNFGQSCDFVAQSPGIFAGNTSGVADKPTGSNTGSLLTNSWSYAGTLATYNAYRANGAAIDALFTSNHDIPRLMNNVVGVGGSANWQGGTITASNAATARNRAKVVFATMMTLPGVSFIYYGDELGMSGNYGKGETKLSPHVDRQYRQPFKWTTADWDEGGSQYITHYGISGDTTYAVTWDNYNITLPGVKEQSADPNSMLNFCRYWTDAKSNDDVLKYGTYTVLSSNEGVFAYKLTYNGTTYYCYHNFTQYSISNYNRGGSTVVYSNGGSTSVIPAYGTIIFR
ncbi:MAG: InlB B-repeat-containing protein [Clostridia bacterium]|nr:InlB B-repeat-containing protein [Clostridia bacterium]